MAPNRNGSNRDARTRTPTKSTDRQKRGGAAEPTYHFDAARRGSKESRGSCVLAMNKRLERRSTVTFLQLLSPARRSSSLPPQPPRAAPSRSDRPPPPPPPPLPLLRLLQKMPRLLLQGAIGDWSAAIIWARFCRTRVKGTRHRVPARSSARGRRVVSCVAATVPKQCCCRFVLFKKEAR